ncbi:hypothetical protein [Rhizobium sp. MHM7A]|uniref:hypothetical protein n=1 Tax=Rhizobium sp. MHM7A TaxID=2583233 RepID=UPI001106E8E1|nr:hypothetical protein [Rhizobium sp. MHM7A]TLX15987.1 hypothetical protein FFR93_01330 [Rhizobium sp. MHM7A]
MNINTKVRVKLTKEAKEILSRKDLYELANSDVFETELWYLMKVFGPHLYQGMTFNLFEGNEIEFIEEPSLTP